MRRLISLLKENAIYASIFLIGILIVIAVFFAFRNQQIMKETTKAGKDADHAIEKTSGLLRWLNLMDLGVRGYALTKNDGLLDPYKQALVGNPRDVDSVRMHFKTESLPTEAFEKYVEGIKGYVDYCEQMIALVKIDSMNQFSTLLKEDRGLGLWRTYQGFSVDFLKHERQLKQEAAQRYERAVQTNIVIQILLFFLGLPSLFLVYYRIRRQQRHRHALLLNLEQNNRKFVFDPGTDVAEEATEIMNSSIQNIKNASDFIRKITSGDFKVTWPGMNDQNATLNHDNLSMTLMNMRDQMKRIQDEDRKRSWTSEGLTKLNEIIRQHQDDPKSLADQATRFLVRCMEAQQGGVFILQEDEVENQFLELAACYAFDKKKFVEKRVDLGEGLIGQSFMEGNTVLLKQVPSGYTHITSGLGEATPSCVMIVPMKYNERTEGVFEIAGFTVWEDYQLSFVEKATEYMAAALSTVRSTQKMKIVLEQMQSQTQQLHAQEEEMRQNMEELAATNEEMKRKEDEYLKKIRDDQLN